jgi:Skp family chaperone for outer membrane proteins
MQNTEESLIKLAYDLTNRVEYLENVNSALHQQLFGVQSALNKSAEQRKTASAETIEATVNALHKAGALTSSQIEPSKQRFANDAEAVHRVLQKVLSATEGQSKTASYNGRTYSLTGGRVVGNDTKTDAQADCLQRMINLLNI